LITKATPLAGAAARTETRCVPTADAALLVYLRDSNEPVLSDWPSTDDLSRSWRLGETWLSWLTCSQHLERV